MARAVDSPAKRPRISIDVDPDLRRRLRIAAAQRDLTIRQYVLEAIEEPLHRHRHPQDDQALHGAAPARLPRSARPQCVRPSAASLAGPVNRSCRRAWRLHGPTCCATAEVGIVADFLGYPDPQGAAASAP